ncbi:MAG: hypothetical protein FJ138_08055, partial [Deltaproteobacteria bacterium]|nr:hypothetical protein [Deltaproteobacteria bacterium]
WEVGAPTQEVCDQVDNDCDGRTDEGFDLMSSLDHCGACDNPCWLIGDRCEQGVCRCGGLPGVCPPGLWCAGEECTPIHFFP